MLRISFNDILCFAVFIYFVANIIAGLIPGGKLLIVFSIALTGLVYINEHGTKIKTKIKLTTVSYPLYIACFTLFCFASRFWAVNSDLTIPKINSLLFILIGMTVISMSLVEKNIDKLLKAIMWGGYFVIFCIVAKYGVSDLLKLMSSGERISNELINANTLGICAAYSIVITFYYTLYDGFKIKYLIMLPTIVIIAVSGSRKAILILIMGLIGLLILKKIKNESFFKTLVSVFWVVIIALMAIFIMSRLPLFALLNERMVKLVDVFFGEATRYTNDAWIRLAYTKLGLNLFLQNPVLGIGIANANIYTNMYYGHDHYLHNNYIELLACGGLVGFLFYYSFFIYLLYTFWKCRQIRDREYDICVLLLVIHLIMDYGMVTFYDKTNYVFLLLFWLEANKLKDQCRNILSH